MFAADNPFRAGRVEALAWRHGPSPDDLLRCLQEQHGRGALVGPKGAGKTTLLLELAARLRDMGWRVPLVRLDERWAHDGPDLATRFAEAADAAGVKSAGRAAAFASDAETDARVVWCLDGAEQLGFLDWRRTLSRTRAADGFIVTTHLPGRLTTLHECRTTPALLRELFAELLRPVGEDAPPAVECKALWTRHGGNLREVFREQYDLWSRR